MHKLVERLEQPRLLLVQRLVAPPSGRSRPEGSIPDSTSPAALITVFRLIPAAATADFPPRPIICAAAPATTRRCRSFRCGNTTPKKRAKPPA